MSDFDFLDTVAENVKNGHLDHAHGLSGAETIYVALASNNTELLSRRGYTIVDALCRLGPDWTSELLKRWGNRR